MRNIRSEEEEEEEEEFPRLKKPARKKSFVEDIKRKNKDNEGLSKHSKVGKRLKEEKIKNKKQRNSEKPAVWPKSRSWIKL